MSCLPTGLQEFAAAEEHGITDCINAHVIGLLKHIRKHGIIDSLNSTVF